jgi:hypothetical protein
LTLAQKLKAFSPQLHGGEAMANGRVGAEVFPSGEAQQGMGAAPLSPL